MNREYLIEALLRREPAWAAVRAATGPTLAVYGPIFLFGRTRKQYRFSIRIDLPRGFPDRDEPPDIWILESPFPFEDDGHVDELGNMCLELPQAHELQYERIGLVGVFDQVVLHLDRFRIYALTGKFPGPQYAHGDEGVRQLLKEKQAELTNGIPVALRNALLPWVPLPPNRQRCPCRSGLRFLDCHKPAVRAARAALAAYGPFQQREIRVRPRNPFRARRARRG